MGLPSPMDGTKSGDHFMDPIPTGDNTTTESDPSLPPRSKCRNRPSVPWTKGECGVRTVPSTGVELIQSVRPTSESVMSNEEQTSRQNPISSVTRRVMMWRDREEEETRYPPQPPSGQSRGRRPRVWCE